MFDAWQPQIRKIALTSWGAGRRVIAVAGVAPGSGVSTLCRGLAEYASRAGKKTLLVDLSEPLEIRAGAEPRHAGQIGDVVPNPAGFDLKRAPDDGSGASLTNSAYLREIIEGNTTPYDCVVVDIPPISEIGTRAADGAAASAACGEIYLITLAGQIDRASFASCLNLLAASSVRLAGLVLNDRYNPTLAAEMAREAGRLRVVSPKLSRWLARKALASRFLSERA